MNNLNLTTMPTIVTGVIILLGAGAKILKVLNRITNINKGIKKIEKEYKEKGLNFLRANYPWLRFSIHREDELHFSGELIGDFVILYPNDVWEIDSTIEKSFERAMKRILKYK